MSNPDRRENLFLAGMMGSGKSTVGKLTAERLDYTFVDTDQTIEKRLAQSVADIFASRGEDLFRSEESKLLGEIVTRERQVVATGGGMLLSDENLALADQAGLVIHLFAPIDVLAGRMAGDGTRPLLFSGSVRQKLAELHDKRRERYQRIKLRIDTTAGDAAQIALTVTMLYKNWIKG